MSPELSSPVPDFDSEDRIKTGLERHSRGRNPVSSLDEVGHGELEALPGADDVKPGPVHSLVGPGPRTLVQSLGEVKRLQAEPA